MSERKEAWMRLVVAVVSGIIVGLWKFLVVILTIFHWFYVVFFGRRNRAIAEFCNPIGISVLHFCEIHDLHYKLKAIPILRIGRIFNPVDMKNKR